MKLWDEAGNEPISEKWAKKKIDALWERLSEHL
jgi:hypothetical protein